MPKNVILATGVPKMNRVFEHEKMKKVYPVVAIVDNKTKVKETVKAHPEADILLISDGLVGKGESLTQIMIDINFDYPNIRVMYLTTEPQGKNQMEQRMKQFGPLVRARVYDIITAPTFNTTRLVRALKTPATKEDVNWIFKYIDSEEEMNAPQETLDIIEEDKEAENNTQRGVLPNLFVFSSIKPGTGKSFTAANIATMIARYGVKNKNGERPRVALIDGDMQNLSIGTLLQVEDDDKNLRTVMDKIHTVVGKDGREIDNPPLVADARAFVRSAFVPYPHVKNLEVLSGSQLQWEQLQDFRGVDFTWLLQTIKNDYDIIIMDSSSSLVHVSTIPMMLLSKQLYYILNLDFNNIRNNSRYQSTLVNELGIFDKVKYILNENITKEHVKEQGWKESLDFDETAVIHNGFNLAGSIPHIEKTTFLNRNFKGEPIVLDDQPHTLEARVELGRIANQIWDIEKLPYLEEQWEKQQEAKKGKRRGLFGR